MRDRPSATPTPTRDERLIEAYRELVDRRAEASDDEIIESADPDRFGILIEKLFEVADNRVSIYSDHLCRKSVTVDEEGVIVVDGAYWSNPEVITAAKRFLSKKDSKLGIIVGKRLDVSEGQSIAGSEFIRRIVRSPDRKGDIVLCLSADGMVGDTRLASVNFVVAEKGYRVEEPGEGTPAVSRFGRPNLNHQLFDIFDQMLRAFDDALSHGAKNCLKLVYPMGSHILNKPASFSEACTLADLDIHQFLIDQVHCPDTPTKIGWRGIGHWLNSLLAPI